jgi:chromosome segregation ATPase
LNKNKMKNYHSINRKGIADIKSVLIPVTLAGLLLVIGLNQIYKQKSPISKSIFFNSDNSLQKTNSKKSHDAASSLLRLKDYLKSIEEKNGFLKEKNDLLTNLLGSKEKELLRLNTEYASLKTDFDTKLNNLNAQLTKKDTEISGLNALKQNSENQIKQLNDRVSVLFNSQATFQSQLNQMQQEKTTLATELDKIKEELKKQLSVNETLNFSIIGLTETLNKKEQERLNIVKELAQLEASFLQTTGLLTKKSSEIEGKQNEISSIKAELDKASKEKEIVLSSLDEKERDLKELKSKLSEREAQVRELEKEVSDAKAHYAKIEQNFDSSVYEKEKSVFQLKGELNDRESQVQALQREIGEGKERESEFELRINEQASLNDSLKSTVRDLYTELELLRLEKEYRNGNSIRDYLEDW